MNMKKLLKLMRGKEQSKICLKDKLHYVILSDRKKFRKG
jgi:hypothetical protein